MSRWCRLPCRVGIEDWSVSSFRSRAPCPSIGCTWGKEMPRSSNWRCVDRWRRVRWILVDIGRIWRRLILKVIYFVEQSLFYSNFWFDNFMQLFLMWRHRRSWYQRSAFCESRSVRVVHIVHSARNVVVVQFGRHLRARCRCRLLSTGHVWWPGSLVRFRLSTLVNLISAKTSLSPCDNCDIWWMKVGFGLPRDCVIFW